MATSGLSLIERISGGAVPGGRNGRVKSSSSVRAKPYGASPRSSSGAPQKANVNDPWRHDKFASHQGIEGGELGARLLGTVGRQVGGDSGSSELLKKAFGDALGKPKGRRHEADSHVSSRPGISIKGAHNPSTGLEVEGLAPGTTAEDVAEIFSQCGNITESRIVSDPSALSVRVFLRFETSQGAQTAVEQFDKKTADGRQLHVFIVSAGSLGSRLGVEIRKAPPKENEDLLANVEYPLTGGGMRSDEIIAHDPRAKVITDPSGANQLLQPSHPQTGPRRGRGRGGRGTGRGFKGRSLTERMDLD